jgi:ATP phosphoribosyltransferase
MVGKGARNMLTFALPKGRMLQTCLKLLEEMHMPCKKIEKRGRELVIEEEQVRYILVKPMDVPTYVHHGVADVAFAGSDVIWETGASLVEIADTKEGLCRLAIAGPKSLAERFMKHKSSLMGIKIATKYPRITKQYFSYRGIQPEIIPLKGSIELAPILGLSDGILDIVQTGETLRANGLHVLEEVAQVSLRIVANNKSIHEHWDKLIRFIEKTRILKERKHR